MAKRAHTSAARSERGTARSTPPAKPKLRLAEKAQRAAVPPPPPPRPPEPAVAGPSREALAGFEAALNALQRHQYQTAADRFRALLAGFPQERPLLDRVRVYLELCERELRRAPAPPCTAEERLTLATAALNNGDDRTAERLAHEVLADAPDHDLALYLMAAVRARQGNASAALGHLRHALEVSPDVQAQARHDTDFDLLKDNEEFLQLLEISAASDRAQARRSRRSRADR